MRGSVRSGGTPGAGPPAVAVRPAVILLVPVVLTLRTMHVRHGRRRVGGRQHVGLATRRCGTLRCPHGVGVVIDGDTVERLVAEFVVAQQRIGGVGGEADHFVAEGGLVDGGGFTVRYARRICLPRGDLDLELGAETTAELDGRARRQRRDVVVALVGHRQTSVRWKEEKLRLAVGPRWPW